MTGVGNSDAASVSVDFGESGKLSVVSARLRSLVVVDIPAEGVCPSLLGVGDGMGMVDEGC